MNRSHIASGRVHRARAAPLNRRRKTSMKLKFGSKNRNHRQMVIGSMKKSTVLHDAVAHGVGADGSRASRNVEECQKLARTMKLPELVVSTCGQVARSITPS